MTQSSARKVESLKASQEIPLLYENGEPITVFTKLQKTGLSLQSGSM